MRVMRLIDRFARNGLAVAAVVLGACFCSSCALTPEAREAKHMANGKRYLAAGDYKSASIEFRVASQNMPKDAEPLYQLGMTYLSGGAATQALQAFDKAVAVNPAHEGAQYQLALFEVGSSKPEDVTTAMGVLQKYSAGHPDSAEPWGALALADAKLGNKEEALKDLHAAVARAPGQLRPVSIVIGFYAAKGDVETAKEIVLH